ncbi:MAG: SprB repeat-containing protein, partial [Bacteroidota bacterium]
MKKLVFYILLIILFFSSEEKIFAQCSNFNVNYPTGTFSAPGATLTNVATNMSGGNYAFFQVNAGCAYQWSTCGLASWDTQITIWDQTGTTSYGYNDDGCSLQSTLTWTATFTGVVRVLLSQYSCSNNTLANATLQWREFNCPICGATGVNPSPTASMNCGGGADTINFTASGYCTGTFEYQISDGGTIVQPWSTTSFFIASPANTTTYTIEARCDDCPSIVVSDTFLIEVIAAPTITGNLTLCAGDFTTLTASGSTGNFEWWTDQYGGTLLDTTGIYTTPTLNTTTTYWAQASGQTSTVGKILITECGLEGISPTDPSVDYIEISNLYATAVNTTGWVVAISDDYSNIDDVNPILWNLPSSFSPCSVVSRTDDSSVPNYWGNNIYWNPGATYNSWAIIIDDVGNVMDFCTWGWTAADLATFHPTINGFTITLGPEWLGDGCSPNCITIAGVPYSIQRIGNNDSNTLVDFVCQASTPDVVNPGLSCGWTPVSCRFPVTVTVLPGLLTDSTFTNPLCNGSFDGTGGITNLSGTGPYTYLWSTTDTSQNITGLNANTYTVTVTDALGCVGTSSITLTNPPVITATSSTVPETCGMSDGTIAVTGSGGTGTLTYSLLATQNTTGDFTGLSAGAYVVTITDANNCTATEVVAVAASGAVTSGFTASPNQCLSGNSFSFTNTGDTGTGYAFSWTFSGGTPANSVLENPTNITFSTTGIHQITQTIAMGGCNDVTTIDIEVYTHPTTTTTSVDVTCNGLCDGSVTANPVGGTGPYTYTWSDGQLTQTASNLCAGTYNYTVTDANGCTVTGNGTVAQNTAIVINSENSTDVTCYGDADGSVTVTSTGGCPPITYAITGASNGNGIFSNLSGGTYTVTITDCNGCTVTSNPITVIEPSALIINSQSSTNATCYGLNDGTFTIAASGGTGALQYEINGGITQPGGVFVNLAPGNYTSTVTDANGCFVTQGFSITQPQEIIISSTPSHIICNSESTTINVSVVGGTAPYTYNWSHTGPISANSITVSPSAETTYTVYVTDINGCTSNNSSTIIYVSPPVQVSVSANTTEVCPGDQVIINVNPTSGFGPPYEIYYNGNLQNAPFNVYPMTTANYTISVEDICGSTAEDDVTITVHPLPSVSFQLDTTEG